MTLGLGLAACTGQPQQSGDLVQVRPPGQAGQTGPAAGDPSVTAAPQGNVMPGQLEPLPPVTAGDAGLVPPPGAAGVPGLTLKPARPDAIRIGLLLPLSGPSAEAGRALLDAAQLALFDMPDDRVLLMPRNTESEADGGPRGAAEALLNDGAEIILGPLFSTQVAAVAEVARPRNVPVISFSSDRTVAGDGVYIMGFTPEEQVERIVAYAASQGLSKFAILTPESPYGRVVSNAFDSAVQKAHGTVVKQGTYPDQGDATRSAQRFMSGGSNYDALLLAAGNVPRLRAVAPSLGYYNLDPTKVRVLGTGVWDDPGVLGEPTLVGAWFSGPGADAKANFADRFSKSYGRRPPVIASLGYDAVSLAAALGRDRPGQAFTSQTLTDPNGFAGYGGIFRFRPDGVGEHGLSVMEIEARGFKTVDPAPTSFQVPTN